MLGLSFTECLQNPGTVVRLLGTLFYLIILLILLKTNYLPHLIILIISVGTVLLRRSLQTLKFPLSHVPSFSGSSYIHWPICPAWQGASFACEKRENLSTDSPWLPSEFSRNAQRSPTVDGNPQREGPVMAPPGHWSWWPVGVSQQLPPT